MPIINLEPAASELSRIVSGIDDDHLGQPTPCADMAVADLIGHLLEASADLTTAAGRTTLTPQIDGHCQPEYLTDCTAGPSPWPNQWPTQWPNQQPDRDLDEEAAGRGHHPQSTGPRLPQEWRSELRDRLAQLVDAWREPRAWQGHSQYRDMPMSAEQVGALALTELVLHSWDLAVATAQEFSCDPASTAAVLALTTAMLRPEHATRRPRVFGPVVRLSPDAPAFDRALGQSGRDPRWITKR